MKKKTLLCAALLLTMMLSALGAVAQNPVKWTASARMTSRTEGVITITATIDQGWHIYGLQPSDDGPVNTQIDFTVPAGVSFPGALKAKQAPVTTTDDMFGCQVSYWEGKVTFTRKYKVTKNTRSANATIKITYMCCNDSSCRPPQTEEITVKLK